MTIAEQISEFYRSEREFLIYEEINIHKYKKSFSERFYHEILIDRYGKIKYPGRYGKSKEIIDPIMDNLMEGSCGVFKSAYSCEGGCTSHVFLKSCNNINCPTCYLSSIKKTAMRETKRFDGIIEFLHKLGFKKCYLRHITFNIKSVPMATFYDFVREKKKLQKIINKLGGRGLLIFHPYRVDKSAYALKMVYSPHFHFIGHIWIPNNFQKRFGFNVWFERWLFSSKDVYTAINYALTHAGYYENKQITSWVGHYSNSKLGKINVEKEVVDVICEKCFDKVYKIDMNLSDLKQDKDNYIIPEWWSEHLIRDKWLKNTVITYDLIYHNRKKKFKRDWKQIFEKKRNKNNIRSKKNES